jgi:hypothetical protein
MKKIFIFFICVQFVSCEKLVETKLFGQWDLTQIDVNGQIPVTILGQTTYLDLDVQPYSSGLLWQNGMEQAWTYNMDLDLSLNGTPFQTYFIDQVHLGPWDIKHGTGSEPDSVYFYRSMIMDNSNGLVTRVEDTIRFEIVSVSKKNLHLRTTSFLPMNLSGPEVNYIFEKK